MPFTSFSSFINTPISSFIMSVITIEPNMLKTGIIHPLRIRLLLVVVELFFALGFLFMMLEYLKHKIELY